MDHTNDSDMSIETNSQALRRGSALARALEERAAELRISQKEVANILQISYPYYALLCLGKDGSEPQPKKTGEHREVLGYSHCQCVCPGRNPHH